jgi:uncharacterized CHY-type Zn-finger protein
MIDRENIQYVKNILNVSNQSVDYTTIDNVMQTIHEHVDRKDDILDSFSSNQCRSKSALLNAVDKLDILDANSTVVIWGGWYGSILIPHLTNKVKKIINIDLDDEATKISKKFFSNFENVDYICDDIFKKYRDVYLDTNLIINTSCEHMLPMKEWKWFGAGAMSKDTNTEIFRNPKLPDDCYFAFQSNNMFDIEGHINCVNSLEEFKDQLPERAKVLHEEKIVDTRGTRYMLVGKFMPL